MKSPLRSLFWIATAASNGVVVPFVHAFAVRSTMAGMCLGNCVSFPNDTGAGPARRRSSAVGWIDSVSAL